MTGQRPVVTGTRQKERPKTPTARRTSAGTESGFDSPTSYKNAVGGSVSLYGEVPTGEKAPLRLQSRYLARMPEDNSMTLKRQLQAEVEATLKRLSKNVTKIFVSDAAKGIRKEVETNPLFGDFEMIIDFSM